MTLAELSVEYRAQAQALKQRLEELAEAREDQRDHWEQTAQAERVRILTAMWREARDLAVLTQRYYERGYRRNAKYTL